MTTPTIGSHWEGCESEHDKCMIAKLQRDLAAREEELARVKEQNIKLRFEVNDANSAMQAAKRGHLDMAKVAASREEWAKRAEAERDAAIKDAERLDWLLWKLPGDAIRYCVGYIADTSNGAEFRAAIDAAREGK